MEAIRTLFTSESLRERGAAVLPEHLHALYDGDLHFSLSRADRPYVIANFVSTLDGVVTFNLPGESEGSQISGGNEADRFIMGLLRASADAIMMGSGTVKASGTKGVWTPASICPPARDLYREYRKDVLKKSDLPVVVILSGTGDLDLNSAVFHTPGSRVVVITTERGRQRMVDSGASALADVTVQAPYPAAEKIVDAVGILRHLKQEFGVGLLLNEGGPTVFGELLAGGLVDELFVTIAPQVAGRMAAHPRAGLVDEVEFSPQTAPWSKLLSAKNAGDYLYLRYALKPRVELE